MSSPILLLFAVFTSQKHIGIGHGATNIEPGILYACNQVLQPDI